MKPDLETFREAVIKYRGNLSKVAASFNRSRVQVENWVKEGGDEWRNIVRDARMRLFDDSLISAELLAKGIPIIDEKTGNIMGWEEKPDGQMIRYLLSTLGRNEGFSDTHETVQDKPIAAQPKEIRVQVVYNSAADLELQENKQVVQTQESE